MPLATALTRWGAARMARRLSVSVPYFGALVALATVGFAIRKKGPLGGSLDTALNAVPYVGALKNAIETVRGDFIADRPGGGEPVGSRNAKRPAMADRLRRIRL